MTPEMSALLSASSALPDSPPANAPNATSNGIFTPTQDLFNPGRPENGQRNAGGLFAKFSAIAANGNGQQVLDAETPVGNGGAYDEDVMMGEAGGVPMNRAPSAEPPHAPARRPRQVPSMTDSGIDVPRMKSITTRSRVRSGTDSSDHAEPVKSSTAGAQKRTVSGNMAHASTSASNPTSQPRRSHRLMQSVQDHIRPSGGRSLASGKSTETQEREKRELRRARLPTAAKSSRAATSAVGRVISGNRKPIEPTERDLKETRSQSALGGNITSAAPPKQQQSTAAIEVAKEREALQSLLELFCKLGSAYYLLSRYSSQSAWEEFNCLPNAQRETPWVLAQMGRAQYEQAKYSEAAELFEKVKRIAPSRMEDMEVYSTVLWHLKGETDLAYLAHELIETDRLSPQAWCAIGNSFSLQRDHDQAVKCFRRATQLDPKFAYAFTLQGHEHVANEEFDKALLAYRSAIAADSRHYNGWYGLGRVYEKMGKYEVAEKHYKNAHHINPRNPVLLVCIGVVLERMRKPQAALLQYNEACRLDPRSALARFKKARVLMNLRKTRMALEELEILKDLAPDEANVHFMLGKLYKMMRDKTSAIRHFTIALNLDPKVCRIVPALMLARLLILSQAAQYIKEAMESLEDDEDDEYDDEDGA
ncbi:anaphase-promoting complex subunit cdc27 [Diplodia seriata]|uniref:Anaphase-promoting complex subunit cdc27 n=1 Tax=Diplodia seriata TaxID=420778 RepID=A0ABR3CBX6_9PEZI